MDKERYLAFAKGFPRERAEAIFEKRFGQKPKQAIEEKAWIYYGPVPKGAK